MRVRESMLKLKKLRVQFGLEQRPVGLRLNSSSPVLESLAQPLDWKLQAVIANLTFWKILRLTPQERLARIPVGTLNFYDRRSSFLPNHQVCNVE